jgi:hypothetical protein
VPKKTKNANRQNQQPPEIASPNASGPVEKPARRAPAKARKAPAKDGTKRARSMGNAVASKLGSPTEEEIQIRAYFISERRHRLALPGNATSDWEEARRQLLIEAETR